MTASFSPKPLDGQFLVRCPSMNAVFQAGPGREDRTPPSVDCPHGAAAGLRAAHGRGARHPVRPPVVHRRARHASSRSRSPRPSSRPRSRRASASTARPSRASPACTSPTCSPSPTPTPSRCCRGAARRPGVARMFCDILSPTARPFDGDPRHVLKRALATGAPTLGLHLLHAPRDRVLPLRGPRPRRAAAPDRRRRLLRPQPDDAGTTSAARPITDARGDGHLGRVQPPRGRARPARDRPALRRRAHHRRQHHDRSAWSSRRSRSSRACTRPSCPSRSPTMPGSGMHTHLSLFEGDANAFHDAGRRVRALARSAARFIAGLLRHAPRDHRGHQPVGQLLQAARAAATRRPSYVCWARNNRSALVRVPMYKPGKGDSTRVEFRSPDSACNPYLAFAVMLAAGLRGIERGLRAAAGARTTSGRSPSERRAWASSRCPTRSARRSTLMERSELVAETLGEHVFDFFLRNKRAEWAAYRGQVTPSSSTVPGRCCEPRRRARACRARVPAPHSLRRWRARGALGGPSPSARRRAARAAPTASRARSIVAPTSRSPRR